MLYLIVAAVVVVAVVAWDLRRSAQQKRALAAGSGDPGDTRALAVADAAARARREAAKGTAFGNNQDGGHSNGMTGPHRG